MRVLRVVTILLLALLVHGQETLGSIDKQRTTAIARSSHLSAPSARSIPYRHSTTRASGRPPLPDSVCVLPAAHQLVYVSQSGSDATGTGSLCSPFATIVHAVSTISDASPSKRYAVMVGPGDYLDALSLPANIFVIGTVSVVTRLGSVDLDDPSWSVDQDSRSGLKDLQLLDTLTMDFVVTQSHQGKFYVHDVRTSDLVVASCNSINQVLFYNCESLGDFVHTGGDVYWYQVVTYGSITIHDQDGAVNPIPDQQIDTRFFGSGGGFLTDGDVPPDVGSFTILNDIPSNFTHRIEVNLYGMATNGVSMVATGDGMIGDTVVAATVDAIPALPAFTNGATLTLLTFATGMGYTPTTLSDWSGLSP